MQLAPPTWKDMAATLPTRRGWLPKVKVANAGWRGSCPENFPLPEERETTCIKAGDFALYYCYQVGDQKNLN